LEEEIEMMRSRLGQSYVYSRLGTMVVHGIQESSTCSHDPCTLDLLLLYVDSNKLVKNRS